MSEEMEKLVEAVRNRRRESKNLEFKSEFAANASRDLIEIVKDIVAMANSGGGIIVFGLTSKGEPSGRDVTVVSDLDPATITDQIYKYTGEQFSDFEILEVEKEGTMYPAIYIQAVSVPLVFQKPGTYPVSDKKQETAFSRGTIYFRHGAKSEPADNADIKAFINRRIELTRQSWMNGIRRVVEAPPGSEVRIMAAVPTSELPGAPGIRIGTDPSLPEVRIQDPDSYYKHRRKDVVRIFNERVRPSPRIVGYDINCVRKVHEMDSNQRFFWKPTFAAPQYSDDFIYWLEQQYSANPELFVDARNRA